MNQTERPTDRTKDAGIYCLLIGISISSLYLIYGSMLFLIMGGMPFTVGWAITVGYERLVEKKKSSSLDALASLGLLFYASSNYWNSQKMAISIGILFLGARVVPSIVEWLRAEFNKTSKLDEEKTRVQ